jgi:hypothetical protein
MDEETLRKMAVEQYLKGKTPVSIYSEIGRTRPWFFKWLRRYRSEDPEWYKDKPKAPHGHPRETSPEMKKLVTNIRIDLEEHPYAQIGTSAIKWEFKKIGVAPPSDRTINRILKREGLVKKNSLYPQGSGISLFHQTSGIQQHPSGGSPGSTIHQKQWPLPFAPCHGSLQSSRFYQPPEKKRRSGCGHGVGPLLEDDGHPGFPSSRQRTLFPGKQSLSSFLWHRPEALPVDGNRGHLHPHGRALA